MGRQLKQFTCPIETSNGSTTLAVVHRYRGSKKGYTDFATVQESGQPMPAFSLTSPENALELARFLEEEINYQRASLQTAPSFEITGFGIKVLCDGKVIKTYSNIKTESDDIDSFSYASLKKSYPDYSSDEYYFIVYSFKDNGMSRDTIERIIEACAEYQKAVLISGDLRVCRPMVQKDIATITGYNNSTVSRAVKETRVFTIHRNYSLNDDESTSFAFPSLFNKGVPIDGENVCTFGIKEKILAMIEVEDKSKPLTDESITEALQHFGYKIARRTVVKYRTDILGIPSSHKRRIKM